MIREIKKGIIKGKNMVEMSKREVQNRDEGEEEKRQDKKECEYGQ